MKITFHREWITIVAPLLAKKKESLAESYARAESFFFIVRFKHRNWGIGSPAHRQHEHYFDKKKSSCEIFFPNFIIQKVLRLT